MGPLLSGISKESYMAPYNPKLGIFALILWYSLL